jgi:hypothetical protein
MLMFVWLGFMDICFFGFRRKLVQWYNVLIGESGDDEEAGDSELCGGASVLLCEEKMRLLGKRRRD